MSKRKMGKISLDELILLAKTKAKDLDRDIGKVLEQDKMKSKKVAVDLLLFNNAVEEIYMRLLHKKQNRRPSLYQFLDTLKSTNMVNDEVYEAISKIRDLRNRVAHSFDILDSIFYVFSRNNYGLANMIKLRQRVKLIVEDVEVTNYYINEAA